MSLRAFHIFFVSVSIALTLGLGLWGLQNYKPEEMFNFWLGIGSFVTSAFLTYYLIWFLKKSKNLGKHLLIFAVLSPLFFYANPLWACAVCFGDPESKMTKGAIAGVLVLLGVIGTVLGGIATVALTWMKRAKKLSGLKTSF